MAGAEVQPKGSTLRVWLRAQVRTSVTESECKRERLSLVCEKRERIRPRARAEPRKRQRAETEEIERSSEKEIECKKNTRIYDR